MSIVDGNQIDELGRSIADHLHGRANQAAQRSPIDSAIDKINTEFDSDYAKSHEISLRAADENSRRIAAEEAAKAKADVAVHMRDRRVNEVIDDAIAEHSREDERVGKNKASIIELVNEKFRADQALQAAYNRGEISRTKFSELVDASVDQWYQDMKLEKGPSKTQSPAVPNKTQEGSGDAKSAQEQDKPSTISRDDLDDNQMEFMLSTKSRMMQYSPKPMTEAEAEKIALERAKGLPKPEMFFSGKR